MTKIIAFCKSKWFIQLLGIIVLSLLIWFFGALVAFAGHAPLESDNARWLTIVILVVLWGLNNLRQQVQANRATAQMVNDLSAPADAAPSQKAAQEIDMMSSDFGQALSILKKTQGKGGYSKQYLYELPWYVIIGPPGSGKTTVLTHSGLDFPLADKFGKGAVRGVGGTRHCDWWFTDQAVLLDTAGRYTTQDSHEAVDKAAWLGFLSLLKKHRPRRPVNGVLVAISLADLIRQTEAERLLHARAIRQRIDELHEQFGIRFPLYMIFTKGDLIAGFSDFFADLSKEEREQVWGVTFANDNSDVLASVASEFDALLVRLQSRLPKRLQEERDLQRRSLIFGFPQRIALLKENLLSFLNECYGSNRYQTSPYLRGIYLTSGTQEGTPIDRLMGLLAQTFQLDRVNVPLFSGKGKSYFISRLLKEVIFAESLLVGVNERIERRQTLLRRGTYGGIAMLILVMSGLWLTSYQKNQTALNAVAEKIQNYEKTATDNSQANFSAMAARMNALAAISDVYANDTPWLMTFGLYQGNKLREINQDSYQQQLTKQFLPLLKARLEQRLKTEVDNTDVLYQLLKVYLMLGEPKRLEAGLVHVLFAIDWQQQREATDLLNHLDNLLKQPLDAQPLDSVLVSATRQILNRIPLAQQVYMRLKSEALQDTSNDFQLARALMPNGKRVFAPQKGSLEQQTIPYLFTYDGFYQLFLKQSHDLAKESASQNWVLGETAQADVIDVDAIEQDMQQYYYADYIRYWDELLANLKIKPIKSVQESVEVLQFASAPDSPLRQLLLAVSKETALTHAPNNPLAANNALAAADKTKDIAQNLTSVDGRTLALLNTAKAVERNKKAIAPLGQVVEDHFKPLSSLVAGAAGATVPFDQTLATLKKLYGYMIDLNAPAGAKAAGGGGGGAGVLKEVEMETAQLPEPLKAMTKTLAKGNSQVIEQSDKKQLNTSWQNEVMPLYASGLAGRYPLTKGSSREITLQDFGRFFAPNGIVDTFVSTYLKNNPSVNLSSTMQTQLRYAEKIQQIFFQNGGQTPAVKFNLKPISLDSKASKFWLSIEGQRSEFAANNPAKSAPFQWPGTDASRSVSFGFDMVDGRKLSREEQGAWALFKLLDKLSVQKTVQDSYLINFTIDGVTASYELTASSVDNPFSSSVLQAIKFSQSLY